MVGVGEHTSAGSLLRCFAMVEVWLEEPHVGGTDLIP